MSNVVQSYNQARGTQFVRKCWRSRQDKNHVTGSVPRDDEHGRRACVSDKLCIGIGKPLLEQEERRRNAVCVEVYDGQESQLENMQRPRQPCKVTVGRFRYEMSAIRQKSVTRQQKHEPERNVRRRCQGDVDHLVEGGVFERLGRKNTKMTRFIG